MLNSDAKYRKIEKLSGVWNFFGNLCLNLYKK